MVLYRVWYGFGMVLYVLYGFWYSFWYGSLHGFGMVLYWLLYGFWYGFFWPAQAQGWILDLPGGFVLPALAEGSVSF